MRKSHLRAHEMRMLHDLLDKLSDRQEATVVDWLRMRNESRQLDDAPAALMSTPEWALGPYEEPPEPPAPAPVPARIPRGPRSGAPGAAATPIETAEDLAWAIYEEAGARH